MIETQLEHITSPQSFGVHRFSLSVDSYITLAQANQHRLKLKWKISSRFSKPLEMYIN